MRLHFWLLSGLSIAGAGFAQNGSVATPVIGFAFDGSAAAIRPIRGIPGAALLGEPVDAGFAAAHASISPRQNFALAAAADDSRLRLVPLAPGVDAATLPEGVIRGPHQIRFSPAGSAALLQGSGRMQALSGLPDHAAVREIDLSALSPAPAAMAVSDDGALVALAGSGAVWAVDTDGAAFQLALPGSTAALSFRSGSHDLLAVSSTGDVHLVRRPGPDPEYRLINAADAATAAPVAAQFSATGSHAYIVNEVGQVSTIEISTGAGSSISCRCRATALEPMNSRNLFRLTSPGQGGQSVLMLFDAAGGEPSVWFVPPALARETEGSVQ